LSKYNLQIDEFYGRISSYHDCGMILGTSRAAHALDPKYLDGVEYNFSFTLGHSPYDSAYLLAVKNYCRSDLMQFDSNRVFILAVDPWVLSTFHGDSFELNNKSFVKHLGKNRILNSVIYILKHIDLTAISIFKVLYHVDFPKNFILSENGRLILNRSKMKALLGERERIGPTIEMYKSKKVYVEGFYSEKRFLILREMSEYFKKIGRVYLVRLPTSKTLFDIENQRWQDFDKTMAEFGKNNNCKYINLGNISDTVITIDGNHIWNGHSKWISQTLNDSLNAL
jgi:hypothetical protein